MAPQERLGLLTNASLDGVEDEDRQAFSWIETTERGQFSAHLAALDPGPAVVDTAVIPGLAAHDRPLTLVLREMPQDRVPQFALERGRPWDLCVVPNPGEHWLPAAGDGFARRIVPVGWIYRHPPASPQRQDIPRILVATGGGGTRETALALKAEIDRVIAHARASTAQPFRVVQAMGPRSTPEGRLAGTDEIIDPGGALDREFARADLVISTAGYNSVLEIATTDTPALLVAIPRSIDDQLARARLWGPRLGFCHEPGEHAASGAWIAGQVDAPAARARWELGPSGEDRAAELILRLTR